MFNALSALLLSCPAALDRELGVEAAGEISFEVSSPGAERLVELPGELTRFAELPLRVGAGCGGAEGGVQREGCGGRGRGARVRAGVGGPWWLHGRCLVG